MVEGAQNKEVSNVTPGKENTMAKEKVFIRDYSKFSSESFRDDISIQNWNNRFDNINHQFNDFYWRLDECVNRNAPIKNFLLGKLN